MSDNQINQLKPTANTMKIKYSKNLKVLNTENLPTGLSCRYLICIKGEGDDLIAKKWKRKEPKSLSSNEVLVFF